jgi:predicted kinase
MKKKVIEILVGIPCCGKSTYSNNQKKYYQIESVSRDTIREDRRHFTLPYKYTKQNENLVTQIFNRELLSHLKASHTQKVILDNTHAKEKYIDAVIQEWGDEYDIEVKFFDIPLFKAYYRNIYRYLTTNKWVPMSVITVMYKNYKKINKLKYRRYVC